MNSDLHNFTIKYKLIIPTRKDNVTFENFQQITLGLARYKSQKL